MGSKAGYFFPQKALDPRSKVFYKNTQGGTHTQNTPQRPYIKTLYGHTEATKHRTVPSATPHTSVTKI